MYQSRSALLISLKYEIKKTEKRYLEPIRKVSNEVEKSK
jgi:hypothetical protein